MLQAGRDLATGQTVGIAIPHDRVLGATPSPARHWAMQSKLSSTQAHRVGPASQAPCHRDDVAGGEPLGFGSPRPQWPCTDANRAAPDQVAADALGPAPPVCAVAGRPPLRAAARVPPHAAARPRVRTRRRRPARCDPQCAAARRDRIRRAFEHMGDQRERRTCVVHAPQAVVLVWAPVPCHAQSRPSFPTCSG